MENRAEKYKRKLSGESRKRAIDRQKKHMCELESRATNDLVKIEKEIKEIAAGASSINIQFYMIFAKELYKISNRHASITLISEAEILEEKWRARGLNYSILDKIKKHYIQAYTSLESFKFNISDFNGEHRFS